jgi:3-oxoadipate enol-lactonase
MTPDFVAIDGARINYRFDGPAGAPVVMLANSLGADLSMWDRQIEALARSFRVLRYDARGHGASSVTPGPYDVDRLGRDAIGLLDALAVDRSHFCGLSLGGIVGMWIAIHAPDRLRTLALCNTAACIGPPDLWNTRIDKVRAGGMTAIAQGVIERWFTPAFRAREPDTAAAMRGMLERASVAGYIACCEAVRDTDQRDAVAGIRAPVLVISGTHDAATPAADGRFLADRIPAARYVELAAAHLSNVEATLAFNDTLLAFLDA